MQLEGRHGKGLHSSHGLGASTTTNLLSTLSLPLPTGGSSGKQEFPPKKPKPTNQKKEISLEWFSFPCDCANPGSKVGLVGVWPPQGRDGLRDCGFQSESQARGKGPPCCQQGTPGDIPPNPKASAQLWESPGIPWNTQFPVAGTQRALEWFCCTAGALPSPISELSPQGRWKCRVQSRFGVQILTDQKEPLRNVDPAAPSCPQALLRGKMLHTDYLEFQWTKFLLFVAKKPKKKLKILHSAANPVSPGGSAKCTSVGSVHAKDRNYLHSAKLELNPHQKQTTN